MNNNIKQGFIKRAQEYGFSINEAEGLFKQATSISPEDMPMLGTLLGGLLGGADGARIDKKNPWRGTAIGGGLGAGGGYLGGEYFKNRTIEQESPLEALKRQLSIE